MHTRSSRQWQHYPRQVKSKRFCLSCQTIVEANKEGCCPICDGRNLTKVVIKK